MVHVDRAVCCAIDLLFFAAGYAAVLDGLYAIKSRQWTRLFWLVPVALAGACLETAFYPAFGASRIQEGIRLASQYRHMGRDLLLWAIAALVYSALRGVQPVGAPKRQKPLR